MKKLLIIAALAMCCCKQQTSECPYTFMGIPLDVTTEEFNQKLKERGFTENEDGTFAGFFFRYPCVVVGQSNMLNTRPGFVRMAVVTISDSAMAESAFKDIREALMEKYSDTAKWCIEDDAADWTYDKVVHTFHIYSIEDDVNCYINMIYVPFPYGRMFISYYNVDYFKDSNKIRSDQMQDL